MEAQQRSAPRAARLMDSRIAKVREYLRAGNNVCPYSSHVTLHYVSDTADFRPALRAMRRNQGVIVVAGALYDRLSAARHAFTDMEVLELWSWLCFLKCTVAAGRMEGAPLHEVLQAVRTATLPYLTTSNPQVLLRGQPTVASCLAPLYAPQHPRFCPVPIVLFTWIWDVVPGIGRLVAVREAMLRAHGCLYDALALVVPLPGSTRVRQVCPSSA